MIYFVLLSSLLWHPPLPSLRPTLVGVPGILHRNLLHRCLSRRGVGKAKLEEDLCNHPGGHGSNGDLLLGQGIFLFRGRLNVPNGSIFVSPSLSPSLSLSLALPLLFFHFFITV